jgi:hypothetical protein
VEAVTTHAPRRLSSRGRANCLSRVGCERGRRCRSRRPGPASGSHSARSARIGDEAVRLVQRRQRRRPARPSWLEQRRIVHRPTGDDVSATQRCTTRCPAASTSIRRRHAQSRQAQRAARAEPRAMRAARGVAPPGARRASGSSGAARARSNRASAAAVLELPAESSRGAGRVATRPSNTRELQAGGAGVEAPAAPRASRPAPAPIRPRRPPAACAHRCSERARGLARRRPVGAARQHHRHPARPAPDPPPEGAGQEWTSSL